jgi:Leu/Phe-tRNA-protein transferase
MQNKRPSSFEANVQNEHAHIFGAEKVQVKNTLENLKMMARKLSENLFCCNDRNHQNEKKKKKNGG